MTQQTFQINGCIIDRNTKKGIPDLQIEAWDKDLIFNDLVGNGAIADLKCFKCGTAIDNLRSFKCHNWAYAMPQLLEVLQAIKAVNRAN